MPEATLWQWAMSTACTSTWQILVDPLSMMMMLIITGVGSLIVWYSTEYMAEDRDYRRFFAEMNFFVFAMLLLVLAANFFFLIVGWAFVGLASYLLIGYYYEKPSAVAAAKKAFVINVIGDVGLVLAAFLIAKTFGSLDYAQVFAAAPARLGGGSFTAEMICLLLFVGCAAKSAQIPLHTWLPDAMEGPTPVSALIHAATMVTAGVYLIVRCNVLFHLAPYASDYIAITGAVTLLVAASIAIVQEDIKRVLAWSTVSQIGYMMVAAGLGLYSQAMFHLLMHAFFKALLFLDRRRGDPRPVGRAEPQPHGRTPSPAQVRVVRDAHRLPGDLRHPAILRLFQQGRNPVHRDGRRAAWRRLRGRRNHRRRDDGLLHVPHVLPCLWRTRARGRLPSAPAHVRPGDGDPGRGAGGARDDSADSSRCPGDAT